MQRGDSPGTRLSVMFGRLTEEESRVAEEFAEHQTVGATLKSLGWSGPGARQRLREILSRSQVQETIDAIIETEGRQGVGTSGELMRFWTTFMRDTEREDRTRLKASEYLGRAHGVIGEQAGKSGVVFVGTMPETNTKAVEAMLARFGVGQAAVGVDPVAGSSTGSSTESAT